MRYTVAEGIPDDPAVAAALFARRAAEVQQALDTVREHIGTLGAAMLSAGDTVLVHDYGPNHQVSVTRAAEEGKRLTVIATACRSRRAHGIRVAEEAKKVGHMAVVVTDAGVAWVMSRGGLRAAFVGADAFLPDGTVLTTPGVLTIAAVGARYGVPVYVCVDLWRLMPSIPPDLIELNDAPDPDGVPEALEWERAGFQYLNPLVDVAPGELFAGFLTEAGLIAPREVGAVARRLYPTGDEEIALH
jgi:methylthioribose-1-phosphate isomerase